ncbi:lariat debranching enzyme [Toxorhynchites rutilus septentrionalis]|uniref:lariat debranching enzyme n=1 Tax=Toxorhynchites rutilus septentrionalis TaxID=329112 RepID=UPI00247A0249|nr:lariat debranching enzyme [Toxorhynchites rutilus septentrionalis]
MIIAIEGCAHGELEKIYDLIESIQQREGYKVDLLICCGDFQSTRNLQDLQCMAVPKKHLDMCTFYKYYSGEKTAPVLTIFIGGNHEASNYLQELPYGGWVAPNIYYLGYAGVVNVNGVKIAGISGIYKGHDYLKGRFEFSPFNESTKRSVYHIRQIDVFRLKQLTPKVDILLSHDWPRGVTSYGNKKQLLRFKPAFREDIEENKLGSAPCEDLLMTLKPPYWFSAHLHCKFSALIPHGDGMVTKFLALDKCLPKRRFLQVLDIENPEASPGKKVELCYDLEWLTILHLTNHLISVKGSNGYMPGDGGGERFNFVPNEMEKRTVLERFQNDLRIPLNFTRITAPHDPSAAADFDLVEQPNALLNPQTTDFCDKLNIDDPLRLAMLMSGHELNVSNYVDLSPLTVSVSPERNDDELIIEDDSSSNEESNEPTHLLARPTLSSILPKPKWRPNSSSDESTLDSSSLSTSNRSAPTPKKQDLNLSDNFTIDDLNLSSPKVMHVDGASAVVVEDATVGNAEERPPNKKFKRRNQAIYAKEDSD